MRVIIAKDYDDMSKIAMQNLLGHMFLKKDRVNLSITAGSTPLRLYEMMIDEVKGKDYLKNVHYYNFDEIPHKVKKQEGVTMTDLRQYFYTPAQIPAEQIHVLDETNYSTQDKRIKDAGGLDAMLLGIGTDGHYCGNLPGTTRFSQYTVSIPCDDRIKSRIKKFYETEDDIPDTYVTMGPASVMAARHLILIANGTRKAEIMKTWFKTEIDINIPASILKLHPNITVIMDKDAASLL
ncbi:MAG: glucosamine-6-phosphate deaminase [Deferribacteraceae bacterium]|nr:glucosamine-6-phosphate deaminase [Deferribacteraceae bacterium]